MTEPTIQDIMSKIDNRTLTIYFMLDTSGSTRGEINNILNREINVLPSRFKSIVDNAKLGNVQIRYRLLRYGGFFDDRISWLVGDRNKFEEVINVDTITPEGNTWLSEGINELVSSLDNVDLGPKPFNPILFILNDGTFSGSEDELIKSMRRLNEIRERLGLLISVVSFERSVEPLLNTIISRDRFNNLMIIENLTSENLKIVMNEINKSQIKPTFVVEDELV